MTVLIITALLLLNSFDDVPVCWRVTAESRARAVTWSASEQKRIDQTRKESEKKKANYSAG